MHYRKLSQLERVRIPGESSGLVLLPLGHPFYGMGELTSLFVGHIATFLSPTRHKTDIIPFWGSFFFAVAKSCNSRLYHWDTMGYKGQFQQQILIESDLFR